MTAVHGGLPVSVDVDARADVFSLGVLLAELWSKLAAGKGRFSVALADMLACCTAADAKDRYPSAALLASDLRRHLTALPLRGVPNRSWHERWHKWRKRHPLGLPIALAAATMIVIAIGLSIHGNRQSEHAATVLHEGQAYIEQGRFREAIEICRTGTALLDGIPFQRELRTHLDETRQLAERGQAAAELHSLCEQVRPLYAAEMLPPDQARDAAEHCRELWMKRADIASRLANQPTPALEERWRIDLLDLGILTAHLESAATVDVNGHRKALTVLTEAEELLGPSGVLYLERAPRSCPWNDRRGGSVRKEVGRITAADILGVSCLWPSPFESRRHQRGSGRSGPLRRTRSAFGVGQLLSRRCALRMKEPLVALASFSACAALYPHMPGVFTTGGWLTTPRADQNCAKIDLSRALTIDPHHGPAHELYSRLSNK